MLNGLFDIENRLAEAGCTARKGQIVDATIVRVPTQRIQHGEILLFETAGRIKGGKLPEIR